MADMLLVHEDTAKLILEALEAAFAMVSERGHTVDSFDWGKSSLSAENIRELNETPILIARALLKAREELKQNRSLAG